MYTPAHFAVDDRAARDLLTQVVAGNLVTSTAHGMLATFLPWVVDPDAGEHGSLLGHLARMNDQWRTPWTGEALVIADLPNGYVTPSWYPGKAEHGKVVPTWNYVAVHAYGELVVHDDADWVHELVDRLTHRHESPRERPWQVADAPAPFVAAQLRNIVGIELLVSRIEAKVKMSQNRTDGEIAGVVAGFQADGRADLAALVRDATS